MWNLKSTKNYLIKQKRNRLADTENKLVLTSGEREAGRGNIGVEGKGYQSSDTK